MNTFEAQWTPGIINAFSFKISLSSSFPKCRRKKQNLVNLKCECIKTLNSCGAFYKKCKIGSFPSLILKSMRFDGSYAAALHESYKNLNFTKLECRNAALQFREI